MMTFLGSAVGDPEARGVRGAGTRDRGRAPATRGWCAERGSRCWRRIKTSDHACGACAARARVRGVPRARRSVGGRGAGQPRLGRAVGRPVGASQRSYAERAYDLMTQYGLEVPWAHLPIAVVAAHRGRLALAREHSERALQLGEEQFGRHTPVHLGTLGFVALQSGDLQTAVRWFAEAEAVTTRLGWRNAGRRWWVCDQIEALLALDRVDDAVRVLDAWEDERQEGDDRALAHVTRCTRSRRRRPRRRHRSRRAPGGRGRAARAGGRLLRARSRTARARGRPAAPAAEARRPRGDRRGARRVRAARGGDVDRAGPRRAGSDRRARARGGPDGRGAARGGPRRRGAHEQGSRRRTLPRRADGRDAPLARVREARRAVAGRARADVPVRTSKVQGNSRFHAEPGCLASLECGA